MFMFFLRCTYTIQVHRTTNLHRLRLENTRLPPRSIAIARPMPWDVDKIDSPLGYRLRLVLRASLLRKIMDTNSKKAQTDTTRTTTEMSRLSHALQRANMVSLNVPTNIVCCGLHGLRAVLQTPLIAHRIWPSHHCCIPIRQDRPGR